MNFKTYCIGSSIFEIVGGVLGNAAGSWLLAAGLV